MKRILSILVFCFFAFISKAQFYPLPPNNLGGLNVLVRDTGGLAVRQTFQLPQYTDTTAANTMGFPKNYDGSVIYTTSDKNLWYRSVVLNQWIKVASGGGATTIYTGDGTLLNNRIVHGNNHSLQFNGQDIFTIGTDNGGISGFPYFYFVDNAGESDWQSLNMAGNANIGRLQLQANTDTNSILIEGSTTEYLNFGGIHAFSGYGFRDSAGVMGYKDISGNWIDFKEIGENGSPTLQDVIDNGNQQNKNVNVVGNNHDWNFSGQSSFGISATGDITETSSAGNIINKAFQQINDTADVINIVGTTGATFQLQGIANGVGLSPDGYVDIEGTGGDGILLNSASNIKLFAGANSAIKFNLPSGTDLEFNNDAGTSGFVLTSQGAGVPPIWAASGGGGGSSGLQANITANPFLNQDNTIGVFSKELNFDSIGLFRLRAQGFDAFIIDSLGQQFNFGIGSGTNNLTKALYANGTDVHYVFNGGNVFVSDTTGEDGSKVIYNNDASNLTYSLSFNAGTLSLRNLLYNNNYFVADMSSTTQQELYSANPVTNTNTFYTTSDTINNFVGMQLTSGLGSSVVDFQNGRDRVMYDFYDNETNIISHTGIDSIYFKAPEIHLDPRDSTINDGIFTTTGLDNYATDISGSFTGLSKINKDYADATYAPIGSAVNFWTESGSDIVNNNSGNVDISVGTTGANFNNNADISITTTDTYDIDIQSGAALDLNGKTDVTITGNSSGGTSGFLTLQDVAGATATLDGNGNFNAVFNQFNVTGLDASQVTFHVLSASGSTQNVLVAGRSGFGDFFWVGSNGDVSGNSYSQPVYTSAITRWDNMGKAAIADSTVDYVPYSQIQNGVYTPTLTNVTNITSATANQFTYSRVGNVVTYSGSITVTTTLGAGTASEVDFSLPIASAFSSSNDLNGVGAAKTAIATNCICEGDNVNDRGECEFLGLSVSGNGVIFVSGSYVIK